LGFSKRPRSSWFNTQSNNLIARFSVDSLKAPASLVASTLQLALNLFDFRSIAGTDSDFPGEDEVQHVNERVSRDVHQFSEHGLFPWSNLKIALRNRNLAARSGQL
jgi:hypothetical protein